jgi:signal transduction histidine kinase
MPQIPFKISARTASLIGKENIASAEGAIIELVKNAYDADANHCMVIFDDRNKKKQTLTIFDNGDGMTNQIILDYWMKIGTSNKLYEPYSEKKRIKSGAKGIGRFALDRLGAKVEMITVSREKNEAMEWKADWGKFEDSKTLDEVFADINELKSIDLKTRVLKVIGDTSELRKVFNKIPSKHGTFFHITLLRDKWEDESLEKLFRSLEALVPPKEVKDFRLTLLTTRNIERYGEIDSPVWEDYDYKLYVNYKSANNINVHLDRREFNWKNINPLTFKEKAPKNMSNAPYDLKTLKKGEFSFKTNLKGIWPSSGEEYNNEIIESIGPFEFTFYFLKRAAKDDETNIFAYRNFDSTKRRIWLDRFGGVTLFRDDFRVRPYGEQGSNAWDWLALGDRAVSSTFGPAQKEGIGWRVNPNQIFGHVKISRIQNLQLVDTTNREGLVSNKTFDAFQKLLKQLIVILEQDRHFIMRPMRIAYDKENEVQQAIEKANTQAVSDLSKGKSESQKNSKSRIYAKAVQGLQEEISERESEIRMLKSLASIGMTISTFTHELSEIRHLLTQYSKRLSNLLPTEISVEKYKNNKVLLQNPFLLTQRISELTFQLSNWIDFSNNSVKKNRRKTTDIQLSRYFGEFESRWSEMIASRGVKLIIDSSLKNAVLKKTFPIDLDSVFNNFLLNSIEAFSRKDSSDARRIKITQLKSKAEGILISYEDSGPGLLKEIKDPNDIFLPFFTTKRNEKEEIGTGLGMWIAKTTVDQYKGYIEIVRPRPNFKVQIFFPN